MDVTAIITALDCEGGHIQVIKQVKEEKYNAIRATTVVPWTSIDYLFGNNPHHFQYLLLHLSVLRRNVWITSVKHHLLLENGLRFIQRTFSQDANDAIAGFVFFFLTNTNDILFYLSEVGSKVHYRLDFPEGFEQFIQNNLKNMRINQNEMDQCITDCLEDFPTVLCSLIVKYSLGFI